MAVRRRKRKGCFSIVATVLLTVGLFFCAILLIDVVKNNIIDEAGVSSSGSQSEISQKNSEVLPISQLPDYQNSGYSSATEVFEEIDVDIYSGNAILINLKNKSVVYDKNSGEKIFPASLTKIMSAIVIIENLTDYGEEITLPIGIYNQIYTENAATAGFLPEEKVTVIDLMYGLLLSSGAECTLGLAEHISGSEAEFVKLMNNKAVELGMKDTKFQNSTGLHDDNHYSTVQDIAQLLKYALNNDMFYEVFTSDRHYTKDTNLHPNGIVLYSTLFSNLTSGEFDGGEILGGKTGFTYEAGQCLASLADIDGDRHILVTAKALGDNKTQMLHIDDAKTVFEYLANS